MPGLDMVVHKYQKVKGTTKVKLISTNPYTVFSTRGQPKIFIQRGQPYYENGDSVEKIPDWVTLMLSKMTKEGRKAIGFKFPPTPAEISAEMAKLKTRESELKLMQDKIKAKKEAESELPEPRDPNKNFMEDGLTEIFGTVKEAAHKLLGGQGLNYSSLAREMLHLEVVYDYHVAPFREECKAIINRLKADGLIFKQGSNDHFYTETTLEFPEEKKEE